jgi:serine/threonine protein kinase
MDGLDDATVSALVATADRQPYSKHPQTVPFSWPSQEAGGQVFLKVFHRRQGAGLVKDLWRMTKAQRFWRQGLALNAAGFNVPVTVLLGEKRWHGWPQKSFVVTEKIAGEPLPTFLSKLSFSPANKIQLQAKRRALAQLGQLVRRFHELGFVHGDLLASNLFVVGKDGEPLSIHFMDNDRTRRYPPFLTIHLRRRNLVQLNRLPLAHVTLQDRLRFLRAYLDAERFGKAQRQVAVWLERKTRQRRREVDGADINVSFRKLMASRH